MVARLCTCGGRHAGQKHIECLELGWGRADRRGRTREGQPSCLCRRGGAERMVAGRNQAGATPLMRIAAPALALKARDAASLALAPCGGGSGRKPRRASDGDLRRGATVLPRSTVLLLLFSGPSSACHALSLGHYGPLWTQQTMGSASATHSSADPMGHATVREGRLHPWAQRCRLAVGGRQAHLHT